MLTAEEKELVLGYSRFIRRTIGSRPEILEDLISSGDLFRSYTGKTPQERFSLSLDIPPVGSSDPLAHTMSSLRQFRNREMVRIAWRDVSNRANLLETLLDLSLLAEHCLECALEASYRLNTEKYGVPRAPCGAPQKMVILGMGKLGGRELNFSSDVDIIFAYPEDGTTDHHHPITNQEFFQKVARDLIKLMSQNTHEGFCFRVDTRLRPFGDGGPLCMSFEQMEEYYEIHGREWERYALIKARPVAGDLEMGTRLMERLTPFIYRKYLDYGAIDSLREMKGLIERETQVKAFENNIKLGPGGIREIEFLTQAFQLIHGGKRPTLRTQSTLKAICLLKEMGLLPEETCIMLQDAYHFLRMVENRLQEKDDQRVHSIPTQERALEDLSKTLGFVDVKVFKRQLNHIRGLVRSSFKGLFGDEAHGHEHPQDHLLEQCKSLWLFVSDTQSSSQEMRAKEVGFKDPRRAIETLARFKSSRHFHALSQKGHSMLQKIIPKVMVFAVSTPSPEIALERTLSVLDAIGRRGFYLALLGENQDILKKLVEFCAKSQGITNFISRHLSVMDGLISLETIGHFPDKAALKDSLDAELKDTDPDDIEGFMETLRNFKHSNTLQLAYLQVEKGQRPSLICHGLTTLADVLVEKAMSNAMGHLAMRYSWPIAQQGAQVDLDHCGFLVVGYGKLGARELTLASDLDLVFLYDPSRSGPLGKELPLSPSAFFSRLGQRIIHILATPTPSGKVFQVDTRLRPNGNAGVLVSPMDTFVEYQTREAWTWEHQALVRARGIAGDLSLKETFSSTRTKILRMQRDPERLKQEIKTMLAKIRAHRKKNGQKKKGHRAFDLKIDPGGAIDIEFFVQYHVLINASRIPDLQKKTGTMELLDALGKTGIIDEYTARNAKEIYEYYLGRINENHLEERGFSIEPSKDIDERRRFIISHCSI